MTDEIFHEIYNKYKNTVYSVIFNYLRNISDTSDLQQEVFIRMYQTDIEFESDEHLKSWLIRVSVNLCKNHLRNCKNRGSIELNENIAYIDNELNNEILTVVFALPEKYRIPIHLFYFEDYSIKQIAEILKIPQSTVKIQLKRGREKLSKLLIMED